MTATTMTMMREGAKDSKEHTDENIDDDDDDDDDNDDNDNKDDDDHNHYHDRGRGMRKRTTLIIKMTRSMWYYFEFHNNTELVYQNNLLDLVLYRHHRA